MEEAAVKQEREKQRTAALQKGKEAVTAMAAVFADVQKTVTAAREGALEIAVQHLGEDAPELHLPLEMRRQLLQQMDERERSNIGWRNDGKFGYVRLMSDEPALGVDIPVAGFDKLKVNRRIEQMESEGGIDSECHQTGSRAERRAKEKQKAKEKAKAGAKTALDEARLHVQINCEFCVPSMQGLPGERAPLQLWGKDWTDLVYPKYASGPGFVVGVPLAIPESINRCIYLALALWQRATPQQRLRTLRTKQPRYEDLCDAVPLSGTVFYLTSDIVQLAEKTGACNLDSAMLASVLAMCDGVAIRGYCDKGDHRFCNKPFDDFTNLLGGSGTRFASAGHARQTHNFCIAMLGRFLNNSAALCLAGVVRESLSDSQPVPLDMNCDADLVDFLMRHRDRSISHLNSEGYPVVSFPSITTVVMSRTLEIAVRRPRLYDSFEAVEMIDALLAVAERLRKYPEMERRVVQYFEKISLFNNNSSNISHMPYTLNNLVLWTVAAIRLFFTTAAFMHASVAIVPATYPDDRCAANKVHAVARTFELVMVQCVMNKMDVAADLGLITEELRKGELSARASRVLEFCRRHVTPHDYNACGGCTAGICPATILKEAATRPSAPLPAPAAPQAQQPATAGREGGGREGGAGARRRKGKGKGKGKKKGKAGAKSKAREDRGGSSRAVTSPVEERDDSDEADADGEEEEEDEREHVPEEEPFEPPRLLDLTPAAPLIPFKHPQRVVRPALPPAHAPLFSQLHAPRPSEIEDAEVLAEFGRVSEEEDEGLPPAYPEDVEVIFDGAALSSSQPPDLEISDHGALAPSAPQAEEYESEPPTAAVAGPARHESMIDPWAAMPALAPMGAVHPIAPLNLAVSFRNLPYMTRLITPMDFGKQAPSNSATVH